MKRELTPVQRQWVEALRSGKYQQAKGSLRRGDAMCCLGVACDLYAKHEELQWEYEPATDRFLFGGRRAAPPPVD